MLPDLASDADLSARGVTPTDVHDVMLTVASALVRQAAGSPILSADSTVVLTGWAFEEWLDLPGQPVNEVASVALDGTSVADWRLASGRLWRPCGWSKDSGPSEVTVEMTHGFTEVPVDVVQLVCDLAILGANTATEGALDPRVVAEKVDDYSVQFTEAAGAVASAMTIPLATRLALRARFGGGVAVVTYR